MLVETFEHVEADIELNPFFSKFVTGQDNGSELMNKSSHSRIDESVEPTARF